MSVGGKVCEVIDTGDRVWIDTKNVVRHTKTGKRLYTEHCAIYVRRDDRSRCVSVGDSVWWQGRHAMWTPRAKDGSVLTGPDVLLDRIGYSGVKRPEGE
jgi:hypothetical protein